MVCCERKVKTIQAKSLVGPARDEHGWVAGRFAGEVERDLNVETHIPIGLEPEIVSIDNVCRTVLAHREGVRKNASMTVCIPGVNHIDEGAAAERNTLVDGIVDPAVWLADPGFNPITLLFQQLHCAVGRTAVNNDVLESDSLLRLDALQGGGKGRAGVEHSCHNAYFG